MLIISMIVSGGVQRGGGADVMHTVGGQVQAAVLDVVVTWARWGQGKHVAIGT
jgi:hypothetical protein